MVTIPILMLNGKYDTIFPLEVPQKPFYELLGTSRDHKRMILYNEGHQVPRNEMIQRNPELARYLLRTCRTRNLSHEYSLNAVKA